MKRVDGRLPVGCVLGLCLVSLSHGAGLDRLRKESDAIVVGSVKTRIEGPGRVTFALAVIRVLQGSVPGPSVNVVHDWAGLLQGPDRVINQSLTGLWFLKKRTDATWDVIDSRPSMYRTILGLFLPASDTPPTPSGTNADLTVRLLEEVTLAFRSGSGLDPEVLVGALDGVQSEAIAAVAPSLLATGDPGSQSAAVAGMLDNQMPDSVSQLVRFWPAIRTVPEKRFVLSALRDNWRDTTPGAVKRLASIAASDSELRLAAAAALAAIHTKETLPLLGSLLYDNDPQAQLHGLYGISAFANGCPVKTRERVVTMEYLVCTQPSAYKTAATAGSLVFRPGTPDQQLEQVLFWRKWWEAKPDLH